MNNQLSFSFFGIWNKTLETRQPRIMKPRDYIWASEMGQAKIDRFLKMKGTEPTNPPNARSLRKFQVGHEWERHVKLLLSLSGIHKKSEEYLTFQYPDLLKVTGRADFIVGGKPDWDMAYKRIKDIAVLGDDIYQSNDDFYLRVIKNFEAAFGTKEMRTVILEIKSTSSFMYELMERTGQPQKHHALQLYHYLKSSGIEEGHIIYVSRDDCRLIEFGVFLNSNLEEEYRTDIKLMTDIYRSDVQPDKELEVLFDTVTGKFRANWKVEYSDYLTMLYGFKEPMEYRERYDRDVASFNRTMKRCVDGAKMTPLNLEVIEKATALFFPNWQELVTTCKSLAAKGAMDTTEEDTTP